VGIIKVRLRLYDHSHHEAQESVIDTTLELKAADGKADDKGCGTITLRLRAIERSKAGENVIKSTRQDIQLSGVDQFSTDNESETAQVLDVALGADIRQSPFMKSLWGIVSKLDVFVQVVDKTSKVCEIGAI
jgi:hypothetical protein